MKHNSIHFLLVILILTTGCGLKKEPECNSPLPVRMGADSNGYLTLEVPVRTGPQSSTFPIVSFNIQDGIEQSRSAIIAHGGNLARKILFDHDDNLYLFTRYMDSISVHDDLPPFTSAAGTDALLIKMDSSNNVLWARTWEGLGTDTLTHGCIGPDNEIYAVGEFSSHIDLDTGPERDPFLAPDGGSFLCKFNSDGDQIWSRAWHFDIWDTIVDKDGFIYITVVMRSPVDLFHDLNDPRFSEFMSSTSSAIIKLDSDGNMLWANEIGELGGENRCTITYIASDDNGNLLTLGFFSGTYGLDPERQPDKIQILPGTHVFLAQYSDDGIFMRSLIWPYETFSRTYLISTEKGNVFLACQITNDLDVHGISRYQSTIDSNMYNACIFPVNDDLTLGTPVMWSSGNQTPIGQFCTDSNNNIYISGLYQESRDAPLVELDPGLGIRQERGSGGYILKLDENLNTVWVWINN